MSPRISLLVLAMVGGPAAAQSLPSTVVPNNPGKVIQTYKQDKGSERGDEIPPGGFTLPVFEESPDGQRYRVKLAGKDAWIFKRDVRPTETTLSVRDMCSTVGPSVHAGATRNANEACRLK
ncbi:hypothetical protein [Variovorax sp. N23]|uniref:hypothetical protein n=1 Tax=Variovorax sp. N23 TaxID=2980555 RepID=UPI0021CA1AF5|nr:hypothetical protein [Variovorax sp. N23]MCU4119414.1 hypothetical protein [Variovorax sp. N23]